MFLLSLISTGDVGGTGADSQSPGGLGEVRVRVTCHSRCARCAFDRSVCSGHSLLPCLQSPPVMDPSSPLTMPPTVADGAAASSGDAGAGGDAGANGAGAGTAASGGAGSGAGAGTGAVIACRIDPHNRLSLIVVTTTTMGMAAILVVVAVVRFIHDSHGDGSCCRGVDVTVHVTIDVAVFLKSV